MTIPDDIRELYQDFRNSIKEVALYEALCWAVAQALEAQAIVAAWRTETAPVERDWLAEAHAALMEPVKEKGDG